MDNFPLMLYKVGGPHEIHGGRFDTLIVNHEDEQDAALADGWHPTTPDAKDAHEAAKSAAASAAVKTAANAEPTRAELEQKANELGITFAPNIGDKKLAERIEEALKG